MEKTILEKRIIEKAEERFQKDYKKFVDFIIDNPIGKRLKIIGLTDGDIYLSDFGCNYALFNHKQNENSDKKNTNYDSVKEELIKEYIKLETDELLQKLENIKYLFE
jgi:hypothetical protein